MGPIYDTLYYTQKHQATFSNMTQTFTEAEQQNWWFKLGIYYGTATYLLFYTPPTIDPFDPMTEYAGLDSGAHLDLYNEYGEEGEQSSQDLTEEVVDDESAETETSTS